MSHNYTNIFISGGTGMVGTNLIEYLLSVDSSINIIATYNSLEPLILSSRINYIRVNLEDKKECLMASENCEIAIVTAAITGGVLATQKNSIDPLTRNIRMDSVLFEALVENNIRTIIYFSSATVYQAFNGYIKENELDHNLLPNESNLAVGLAKRTSERLLYFIYKQFGVNINILRCANIYGPYNRFDPDTSNFIPALIRKASERQSPFHVWGNSGIKRDVIYVKDVCNVVYRLIHQKLSGLTIFNVGTGKTTTVQEVLDIILDVSDFKNAEIIYSDSHLLSTHVRALNCLSIKKHLDWNASTDLHTGISMTVKWWNDNKLWWEK